MLKKEFEFTDPEDGSKKTETVYFHLYEADLAKLQLSVKGGMFTLVEELVQLEDVAAIIAIFDEMIEKSVGYRNANGKFIRTKGFAEEFMSSEAYSDLFIELLGTPQKQIDFIKGILPANLAEEVAEKMASDVSLPEGNTLAEGGKKLDEYSREELLAMPQQRFDELVGTDPEKMSREHLIIATQRKMTAPSATK